MNAQSNRPLASPDVKSPETSKPSQDAETAPDRRPLGEAKARIGSEQIRILHTGCVLLLYLGNGISVGVMQTSIVDVLEAVGSTIEHVSVALSMSNLGQMLGAFSAACILKKYRDAGDAVMGLAVICDRLIFSTVPWFDNVVLLGFCLSIRGVAHGLGLTAAATAMISEWGKDAASSMYALYMAYSAGCLVGPIITVPFLSNIRATDDTGLSLNSESNISIPFMISGGLGLFTGVGFLILHMKEWRVTINGDHAPTSNIQLPAQTHAERCTMFKIAILLMFIYMATVWKDDIFSSFLFYIAVTDPLNIPKRHAAILVTVSNASWTLGRVVGTAMSKCVRVDFLVFASVLGTSLISVLLSLIGLQREVNIWALALVFQLFAGPTQGSIVAWADRYVHVDPFLIFVMEFGTGFSIFSLFLTGGYIVELLGPRHVFISMAVAALVLLVLVSVLQRTFNHLGGAFKARGGSRAHRDKHREEDVLIPIEDKNTGVRGNS